MPVDFDEFPISGPKYIITEYTDDGEDPYEFTYYNYDEAIGEFHYFLESYPEYRYTFRTE